VKENPLDKTPEQPGEQPLSQEGKLKPYVNQRAMENCLKAHPGLTEEEFKEMAENAGF